MPVSRTYQNYWIPDQVRNDKTGVFRLFTVSSKLIFCGHYFIDM